MTAASPLVCISPFPINDLNCYPLKASVSGQSRELLSAPVNAALSEQSV